MVTQLESVLWCIGQGGGAYYFTGMSNCLVSEEGEAQLRSCNEGDVCRKARILLLQRVVGLHHSHAEAQPRVYLANPVSKVTIIMNTIFWLCVGLANKKSCFLSFELFGESGQMTRKSNPNELNNDLM